MGLFLPLAWAGGLVHSKTVETHLDAPKDACDYSTLLLVTIPPRTEGLLRFSTDPTDRFWVLFNDLPAAFDVKAVSGFSPAVGSGLPLEEFPSRAASPLRKDVFVAHVDPDHVQRGRVYELQFTNRSEREQLVTLYAGITDASLQEMLEPDTRPECR
ncbi:MAG: hypothetical protein AAB776_00575 [Patescibacteria group bacterium]